MPTFASARERRLWTWTLCVLLAIYSTLGPAAWLAELLRELNLLRLSFAVIVAAIVGLVVRQWLKARPGWREIGVGLGVAFVYLMVLARMPIPEERTHLMEYSVVASLIHMALLERRSHGGQVPRPALLAIGATMVLGLIDECIQSLLPDRRFDLFDMAFNALAALMAIGARVALQRVRTWTQESRA